MAKCRRALALAAAFWAACSFSSRSGFAGIWRAEKAPQILQRPGRCLSRCSFGSDFGQDGAPDTLEALVNFQGGGGMPGLSRYKGNGFNQEACMEACDALAQTIAKGNQYHFDGLLLALRLMMPPASGAEKAMGAPRDDFILRPEILVWSKHDFLGGLDENLRIVQDCEAQFARMMANNEEGFRAPEILAAGMDLAVVYLKNYALDKADALYTVMEGPCLTRGLPWNVKWYQDLATLRCKQHRQAEAAPLLEEVAKLTPPHEATLRNLGTVYNQLREFDKAKVYFQQAADLIGRMDKEDLWNLGLVAKNKGNYEEGIAMLEKALEQWLVDDPNDDVTLAKLYDSVGSCYDDMGRHADAIVALEEGKALYDRSIGTESPLFGSACERLARALVHAGRHQEGLNNIVEAFTVIALQDAVHPTPLFELLGIALEDIPISKSVDVMELAKLEVPIQAAVRNMHYRGLDRDGNAGVLFERMARAMVLCSGHDPAGGDESRASAKRRRSTARALLNHAAPLVEQCTKDGLADLTHVSMLIRTELGVLDSQDAASRMALNTAGAPALGATAATAGPAGGSVRPPWDAPAAAPAWSPPAPQSPPAPAPSWSPQAPAPAAAGSPSWTRSVGTPLQAPGSAAPAPPAPAAPAGGRQWQPR